jgi:hypothetical protein
MLTVSAVDQYVQAFRRVVGPALAWPNALLSENDTDRVTCQLMSDADIARLASNDARDLAPLLIRLLRGQVVTDHHLWMQRTLTLTAVAWPVQVDALLSLASLTPRPIRRQLYDPHLLTSALSYAVLESVLRTACSAFVQQDGRTVAQWTASSRTYAVGDRVNRVEHLLMLFRSQVANAVTRTAIDACETELTGLNGSPLVLNDQIGVWRNELLHGERMWTARTPVVNSVLGVVLLDRA